MTFGSVGDLLLGIVTLVIPGIVGYLIGRRGLLPADTGAALSRIVIDVLTPALIFSATVGSIRSTSFSEILSFLVLSVVFLAIQLALTLIFIPRGEEALRGIPRVVSMFGNLTYVALPLSYALFGDLGVLYSFMFALVHDLYFWIFVPKMLSNQRSGNIRSILNPCLVALVASIVVGFSGLTVPRLILAPLELIGQATIPLALLILGSSLVGLKWRRDVTGLAIRASVAKLVVFPALVWAALSALVRFAPFESRLLAWVVGPPSAVLMLHFGAPAATFAVILAARFEKDVNATSAVVLAMTLVSLVTIPVWLLAWSFTLG